MTDFCVAKLETASTPVPPVSGPDVTEVAAPATVMSHSDINELKKQLDGKFEYEVTDSSVTITKYIGSAPNVEIPHGVTSIGDYAFEYCESLTSVTIPDSVTSIGWGVFSSCYDLTIYGKSGSEAERYAEKEGIKFQVR
ncbi:MAG: leucine-rich repeat domain-containing protein [Planctomycetaceae bacterium]|nr:leucine-rich repeat domain-containing protein [Planctomycetaceae bacterium]